MLVVGIEEHLLLIMTSLMDSGLISNSGDRWVCDLVSDGNFRVKEIRNYIDDLFLPHQAAQTRWIKYIPIKGITIESSLCPVCSSSEEIYCHYLIPFVIWLSIVLLRIAMVGLRSS
ncbi:hypothetical protein Tco_0608312 [Tanacetum coccineum]